jgi:hypothetical protein
MYLTLTRVTRRDGEITESSLVLLAQNVEAVAETRSDAVSHNCVVHLASGATYSVKNTLSDIQRRLDAIAKTGVAS